MFKAARDHLLKAGHRLAASWRDLRGRGMVGLFLFEIIVVTLGVLLAQSFADWARERERDAEIEASRIAAIEAAGNARNVAVHYDFVIGCFEDQMRQIMLAANGEAEIDPLRLRRPSVRGTGSVELSAEMIAEIAQRHGDEHAQAIRTANQQAGLMMRRIDQLIEGWRAFALIDPRYGTPAPSDFRRARETAAETLQVLRGMRFNSANIQGQVDVLGAYRDDIRGGRGARTCEEMWSYGEAWFDPEELDDADQPTLPRVAYESEAQ